MKVKKLFLIIILFIPAVFLSAVAQNISVTTTIDTNQIFIGDHVKLNVEVVGNKETEIYFPEIGNTIKIDSTREIEILSAVRDSADLSGMQKLIYTFTLTTFDSGYYVIPPLQLRYRHSQLDSFKITQTEPMLLTVHGVEVDTSAAIKPIKEPLKMPFVLSEIIKELAIGAGILALIVAFLLYFFKFRKKKPAVIKRFIRKEPAHDIALNKLRLLDEKKLWQKGEVKQYYSELSDIIREYIELRWNIPALESTTDEIMSSIGVTGITQRLRENLFMLLQSADLVKFAKANPLPDEHKRNFDNSIDFVNTTKTEEQATNIEVTETAGQAETKK